MTHYNQNLTHVPSNIYNGMCDLNSEHTIGRRHVSMDRALDRESGDLGFIVSSATDLLGDFWQVTVPQFPHGG